MRKIVSSQIVFLAILAASSLGFAKEAPDSFNVSLEATAWNHAPDLTLTNREDGSLHMSTSAFNAWANPKGRWPATPGVEIELGVDGMPNAGRIIPQVEWVNREGVSLSVDTLERLSGSGWQSGTFKLTPPPETACFMLKFWMEADGINASISSITLKREPVWKMPSVSSSEPLPEEVKVTPDAGLESKPDGTTTLLTLSEGTGSAGGHFDTPVTKLEGSRILLPVLELPADYTVTVQALGWNGGGEDREYLGHVELAANIAEIGDYEFEVPDEIEGKRPTFITLKVWAIGKHGLPIRIGAPRFSSP